MLAGGDALAQSWLFVLAAMAGAALAALAHRAHHAAPREADVASGETSEVAGRRAT